PLPRAARGAGAPEGRREAHEADGLRHPHIDRPQAQSVEPPPRRPHTGGREGEHRAHEDGDRPDPPNVTFHTFRRTYAPLHRPPEPPEYVAAQLGHEDSRFTARVSRQPPWNRRDRLTLTHGQAFDRALE